MSMSPAHKTIFLKDYKPSDYLIDKVDLHYTLDPTSTTVNAKLKIRKNPAVPAGLSSLVLQGNHVELVGLKLNYEQLNSETFKTTEETLEIPAETLKNFQVKDTFTLEIITQINPQNNTSLEGLYWVNNLFCTQCEAQGFRKMTYYLDRPDVMATFTTTIEADKTLYPVLLSNGNCIEVEDLPNNRHRVKWEDPFKKPCYLFALVAGNLDEMTDYFTTVSGRKVTLKIYVDKGNLDKCEFAMEAVKRAMKWDEDVFGREYDLDIFMIVAVNDFNMGAMENKGLNIFNAKYILARPETATDSDFAAIERVIGHEYFHNWTGNRITCRDWFQLSLKESLTMFRDAEFSSDMTSRPVVRIMDANLLRSVQFAQDASPMAHPVRPESYMEINNFYTVTVYNKGAEVIRMLHTLFGAEGFRRGMDLYFERFDGQAVTVDDFVQAIADPNHFDPTEFKRWYSQAGTPELFINNGHYDEKTQTYYLSVKQNCPPTPGQPHKDPFLIPLAVGLLDSNGKDFTLHVDNDQRNARTTYVLSVTEREQTFTFNNISSKPIPSLLRGFSAPVKIHFDYTDEDLQFLLAHDSDPFARWDAGQQLSVRVIKRLITAFQQQQALKLDSGYIDAWRSILKDNTLDKSYKSLLLLQPSESYIAELMDIIDIDAIVAVQQFMVRELAHHLHHEFLKLYNENNIIKPYLYDQRAVAERDLKNRCLAYLRTLDNADSHKIILNQLQQSNNMTDEISALNAIANSTSSERESALQHFYDKWQSDTLVLDKWFTIIARSELPETFAKVKGLLKHPAFNIKNPNKVRALLGAFTGNTRYFHAANGEGYAFITDQILMLNTINPMIASRLLEPFTRWRKYDANRQNLMKTQLERVAQTPNIDKAVYEVVTKSLASE